MPWPKGPFAELHRHLIGGYSAAYALNLAVARRLDLSAYENHHFLTYQSPSRAGEVIRAARRGEHVLEQWQAMYCHGPSDVRTFASFQVKYHLAVSCSAISDPQLDRYFTKAWSEELSDSIGELAEECVRNRVDHCEVRLMLGGSRTAEVLRQTLEHTTALMKTIAQNGGPRLTLAVSLPRRGWRAGWEVTQDVALGANGEHLTAIDFCHIEERNPPKILMELSQNLHAFNDENPQRALALLYHVGESFEDKSLESAIRWCQEAAEDLGAHRLGHGIALGIDPDHFGPHQRRELVSERLDQVAYDLKHRHGLKNQGVSVDVDALITEQQNLKRRDPKSTITRAYDASHWEGIMARQAYARQRVTAAGAILEVCPTSNLRIAGIQHTGHHPVRAFLADDTPFIIASDDPGILDIRLVDEYRRVQEWTGCEDSVLNRLAERAYSARSEVLSGRVRPS